MLSSRRYQVRVISLDNKYGEFARLSGTEEGATFGVEMTATVT